jgi:putative hydrolase of the HAD superfamily
MVPQAILFDLDETLLDRTRSIVCYAERLQRDFADRLAPTTASTIAATIMAADERGYRPREELWRDLVQHLPWQTPPEVLHLHRHWERWFPASSVAREGLRETLTALHAQGIRLGVITNGAVQRQQPKIEHLRLRPYLASVMISEAVGIKKPDPRIFARALAELGCHASQAWFVGDHPVNDVLGAAAVGLRPIWLTGVHSWPTEHPEPLWHIRTLTELVALVQHERHDTT